MFGKRKVATLVAEFLGTGVLTLLVLSVHYSQIGVPFFIAIAAGLALALMVFVFGDVSGGYFNPAITLGLWTVRKLSAAKTILYVAAQLLGGWAAYGLFGYFVNNAARNPHVLLPLGGSYTTRILIAESVGAAVLAFGVAAAVYRRYTPGAAASFVGLAYVVAIIAASTAALGLLNPAVALGARAWVPWGTGMAGWGTYALGPVIGALVGINLYDLLFSEGKSSSWLAVAADKAANSSSGSTSAAPKKKSTRSKK